MKKLYKRMFREIASNFGQFLSIVLIIAVGAMLMSGMFSSITAMDRSTYKYYSVQNMADLWVYFKGISDEDIKTLAKTDGVISAEGRYTINEQTIINESDCSLRLHSLTDINRPLLTEGQLPKSDNEIIIDYKFANANHLTPGSTVKVGNEILTITGLCMNPEYAYKQKDAATAVTSNSAFGIVYAQKETLLSLIRSSDVFSEQADEVQKKLDEAKTKIDEAETKLSDATNEYEEGKGKADQSFEQSEVKLQQTKEKLDRSQNELTKQKNTFEKQMTDAQTQIDTKGAQLLHAQKTLDESYAAYKKVRETLTEQQQVAKDTEFQSKYTGLSQQQAALETQQSSLDTQKTDAQQQFSKKQTEHDNGYLTYKDSAEKLAQSKTETYSQLNKTKTELDNSKSELSKNRTDYLSEKEKAQDELDRISRKYQEVLLKTSDSEAVLSAAKSYESYISGVAREDQASYVNVSGSLDPIRSVSYIFPLIFFLVAAAIAFISLSKSVENQRTQIAVMQALGISKAKIRGVFLSYSAIASVLGAVPFAILGNRFIPKMLIRVFSNRFALPQIDIPMYAAYILLPLLLGIVFCGTATLIAVQKVLKEIPAQAMRPRPPKGSKTILIERFTSLWSKLSYSNKLILRNFFLNKGRILLSSVGIVGSVMLILTGLSLRDAAICVVDTTINSMSYDLSVIYKEDIAHKSDLEFDFPIEKAELSNTQKATLNLADDVGLTMQTVERDSSLIHLYNTQNQPITMHENSVIIPDSIATDYGISVGDVINVTVDDKKYSLKVTDISVQYAAKTMYLSFESAKAVKIDTAADTGLVKLADESEIQSATGWLTNQEDVKSVNTKEDMIARSKDMLKTLNATILLILISAAILAVTVIYNITSINIFERTREYATLMVLGYYKKEVNRLTLVENLILTALGCLLGLPSGYYLFQYLADIISASSLRIPTGLNPVMVAVTIALTFFFALLSNLLLRPKIKNIVLVEALKSVE
ncbi:MAG: hypothetical protein BGN88_00210 [Clostridiales bacterium 43-6]|nr:MAG: hypothetical protein BGN88_00210 [Clostridiales bacterium 43-6]